MLLNWIILSTILFHPDDNGRSQDWIVYRSQSGLYAIQHPVNWKVEHAENDSNILNIYPDDDSGAVTISAYVGDIPMEFAEQVLEESFKEEAPTSPLIEISGIGWHGLHRTFVDELQTPQRDWIAIVALNDYGMAFITSNIEDMPLTDYRSTMRQILNSLTMNKPD